MPEPIRIGYRALPCWTEPFCPAPDAHRFTSRCRDGSTNSIASPSANPARSDLNLSGSGIEPCRAGRSLSVRLPTHTDSRADVAMDRPTRSHLRARTQRVPDDRGGGDAVVG